MKLPSIAYITPVLRYDKDAKLPVVEYRDPDTGEVDMRIPGERTLKAYREAAVNPAAEAKVAGVVEEPGAEAPAQPPATVSLTV